MCSAHNFAPVRSVYRWQGEVHECTEGRVSLHTRASLVPVTVERVKASHPYEVPGISSRPIIGGKLDYLEWIAAETEDVYSRTPDIAKANRQVRTLLPAHLPGSLTTMPH